jgi:hypothetical protein
MRFKVFSLTLVFAIVFPSSASAFTYIKWTAFGPTYQSASFSFVTEPIVVTPTDVRKMNYATLPLCRSLKEAGLDEIDCIKRIDASVDGKNWIPGSFDSYIPVRQQVIDSPPSFMAEWARTDIDLKPGQLANNVPGSRSSLWSFPGVTHRNGNQFMVSYQIGTPVYNDRLNYEESFTELEIQPVVSSLRGTVPDLSDGLKSTSTGEDGKQCFQSSKASYCLTFYPFDNTDVRFRISVNLTKSAESLRSSTWMYTHSSSPYLDQKQTLGSLNSQDLTFELSPTAVQIPTIVLDSESLVTKYVDSVMPPLQGNNISEVVRAGYEETKQQMLQRYLEGITRNNGNYTVSINENSFSLGSTYLMGRQDAFMTPKNTKEFIGLRVQTLPLGSAGASGDLYQALRACPASKGIAGLISTNATAAETTPPTLDKATQTLKYRVAAPHLKENGSTNNGFYRLQLNPQIAKCIWGENLLGAKAEISIVNDSGEVQVTTSTFTFNNDAAIFEISGFHYSSGTINMKLVMPALTKTDGSKLPTDSKSNPVAAPKRVTISCIKGKTTKKVTAIQPKCPSGYRKK